MLISVLLLRDIPLCPNTVAENCSGFFLSSDCPADANGNRAVRKKHRQRVTTDNHFALPAWRVWLALIRYPSQDVAHQIRCSPTLPSSSCWLALIPSSPSPIL